MVLPGLGPANGCWLGEEHPVITICTDLGLPEASEAVKVKLKNPENQVIKDQSLSAVAAWIHKVPNESDPSGRKHRPAGRPLLRERTVCST